MRMLDRLRAWWQFTAGEDDTSLDGDMSAWLVSLVVHLAFLFLVAFLTTYQPEIDEELVTLTIPTVEEPAEPVLTEEFYFDELVAEEMGADSLHGEEVAFSEAPIIFDSSAVPTPPLPVADVGNFELLDEVTIATGLHVNQNFAVKGAAGMGTTGADGAIDRITHEILMSLDERDTLVVWFFDRSGSLTRQRKAIYDRLDRIYDELGVIREKKRRASDINESALLSSVIAFGQDIELLTRKPTDDVEQVKDAVASIQMDESGVETVFRAIGTAAQTYRRYRLRAPQADEPQRNVLFIVFTDEVGDDGHLLDETVDACRKLEIPVYVVGIPAPFGRDKALVKWVDPDPNFDQTPQWGEVDQGPESLYPERLKLHFATEDGDTEIIDSGFGPYALTRLCFETGGIYFTVHPNRMEERRIPGGQVEAFSAHINYFFDPEIMRKYRPDYVSLAEYQKRANASQSRTALLKAAQQSWLTPLESPRRQFVRRDEASLANSLTAAQRDAAKLEPKLQILYEILKQGEKDRDDETSIRWQAGYDLAMGRLLATKVRTEAYNAMLAAAKRGIKFENEGNNTWVLQPDDEIAVGSQLKKLGDQAREYLERVEQEHAGTPWALLAQRELEQPFGWKWTETFTDLSPPRNNNNNRPRPPRDDERRMMAPPKPKRPVPKL
ncbi:MAG: VWA domain-containing protein [Planctomycetales bacterium]|nr:VWA domain-containing protein [Planctomycetales bacterium]